MSKLTDSLQLSDFGNSRKRGEKTIEAAKILGNKADLNAFDQDIFIEAGYFQETGNFKSADEIINSRLDEIFSVMGFAAETSIRWKSILEDDEARNDFIITYRKGAAGLYQRKFLGKK